MFPRVQLSRCASVFTRQTNTIRHFVFKQFDSLNLTEHHLPSSFYCTAPKKTFESLLEPNDVGLPPEIPEYDTLALKFKGYDFTVLERFAKHAHSVLRSMTLTTECYPMPCKSIRVNTYRLNSTIIDKTYNLDLYERVIVISNLPSIKLSPLITLLTCNTPEGVMLDVDYLSPSDEESRYIPDRQLLELQGQLEEIAIAKKKKK